MEQNETPDKRSELALVLASGTSVTDAAQQLQISRSTIYRELDRPEFRQQVANYRARICTVALGRMTGSLARAADTLVGLLEDEQPHIRLKAARALLTLNPRIEEAVSTTERVRELEQFFNQSQA
ncbi:MAG: helix-turn-helix domain-containing protein [Planctomycetes bacterium]|nr:helix-turn-helix domain-containing protein [Planctomycetota bacterium]